MDDGDDGGRRGAASPPMVRGRRIVRVEGKPRLRPIPDHKPGSSNQNFEESGRPSSLVPARRRQSSSFKDVQGIIDEEFQSKFDGFPKRSDDPSGYPPNIFKKGVPMLNGDSDKDERPNTVYVEPPRSFKTPKSYDFSPVKRTKRVDGMAKPAIRRPPPQHPGVSIPGVSHPPNSGSIQVSF